MSEQLTDHEKRLLDDFLRRRRGMNILNAGAGLAGCVGALFLAGGEWPLALLAALGGALIGVSLEKRYLNEMREVIVKLSRDPG